MLIWRRRWHASAWESHSLNSIRWELNLSLFHPQHSTYILLVGWDLCCICVHHSWTRDIVTWTCDLPLYCHARFCLISRKQAKLREVWSTIRYLKVCTRLQMNQLSVSRLKDRWISWIQHNSYATIMVRLGPRKWALVLHCAPVWAVKHLVNQIIHS